MDQFNLYRVSFWYHALCRNDRPPYHVRLFKIVDSHIIINDIINQLNKQGIIYILLHIFIAISYLDLLGFNI